MDTQNLTFASTIILGLTDDIVLKMAQDIDIYCNLVISIPAFARKVYRDGVYIWQKRLGFSSNTNWSNLTDMLQRALNGEFKDAVCSWKLNNSQIFHMNRPASMTVINELSPAFSQVIRYNRTDIEAITYEPRKTIGECCVEGQIIKHSEEISFDNFDIPTIVTIKVGQYQTLIFEVVRIYEISGTDYKVEFQLVYDVDDGYTQYSCEVMKGSKLGESVSFDIWFSFIDWFNEFLHNYQWDEHDTLKMYQAFNFYDKLEEIFSKLKNLEYTLQLHESIPDITCDRHYRIYVRNGSVMACDTDCSEYNKYHSHDDSVYIGTTSGERLQLPPDLKIYSNVFYTYDQYWENIPTPPCVINAIYGTLRQRIEELFDNY